VSVGSAGNERQITNVAAGTADTDAVNVSQLKAAGIIDGNGNTNSAVTYDHNGDGSTNYNSITLGGGDAGTVIHNIADGSSATDAVNKGQMDAAINQIAANAQDPMFAANGDRATETASATGDHATAMGANASASADNSVALGAGSVADRANTVSVGSEGHARQITNVAAGTADGDAVNYAQYKSGMADTLSQANSYTDSQMEKSWTQVNDNFDKMNNKINQVSQQANKGIAAASALINVTPYVPGHTAVNAGVANYRGATALGVGISRWSDNGRVNLNAGVSAAQGDKPVVRVGVGYVF
jgi:autotransporter adhesin